MGWSAQCHHVYVCKEEDFVGNNRFVPKRED